MQSRGILPFLSPPFLYRGRAGGLAPHARRGVAPRVGASPAPGTMKGGDSEGRCDLCLTTRQGVGNVYAHR